jgi:hypothetical protein
MASKKKKSPTVIILILLTLCIAAGILYPVTKIFAPVEFSEVEVSQEDAESCQAKITKILIDETLAFNYQNTQDISFTEPEINAWLREKRKNGRVVKVQAQLEKDRITFSGLLSPFSMKESKGEKDIFLLRKLQNVTVAFQIVTKPIISSNRIIFEPVQISFGRLQLPLRLMPELPKALHLNPFEEQIRTIKEIRTVDGAFLLTVYAD